MHSRTDMIAQQVTDMMAQVKQNAQQAPIDILQQRSAAVDAIALHSRPQDRLRSASAPIFVVADLHFDGGLLLTKSNFARPKGGRKPSFDVIEPRKTLSSRL
jgi:hypothetical protein